MDKYNLCREIVESGPKGTFLECVYQASRGEQQNRDDLADLLISLHNKGELDVVCEFKKLENKPNSKQDFFLTRHLFEKILPRLNAPILPVMHCVLHLVNESGQDLSAGWLFPPLIEFCKAAPSRVDEALDLVLTSPENLSDALSPILVAGSNHNLEFYLQKAIDFSLSENAAIRRNAVHALGSIKFPADSVYPSRAMNCLKELSEKENDEGVLRCLVSASCHICIKDNLQSAKGIDIIRSALSKGSALALYSASELFAYKQNDLPETIIDCLLPFFLAVDPKHVGTLRNIGFGISTLLKQNDPVKGIEFLENLLRRHQGNVKIESLNHLVHDIYDQGHVLLNRLLTRWFCTGDFVLCNSIHSVLNEVTADDILLDVDVTELPSDDPVLFLFIARKAIGFLFMKPVTCCSIILSLMKKTQDHDLIKELSKLLFDPILLNFSGKPYDFLNEKIKSCTGVLQKAIQDSIDAVDYYLETLRSMPNLPEMFPSQEQREAKMRHYNRKIAESYRATEKDSIFNLICSKSLLLYGNTSIMQVQIGSEESKRMEIPIEHHSISMEIPRQGDIDPFSLDYTLRIFRNERIVRQ